MRMTAIDKAPGNWIDEHNKSVSVNSGTDFTNLFSQGSAYITYNDPFNGGWYFDRNVYWVQPQTFNVWGIRTRWTWFNQQFVHGDWELNYAC